MKPIITAEKLGKKYIIHHESQTRYKSLREEIMQLPKKMFARQDIKSEFWAVKDVSFDIMPGDRVGIIGRNGAGKSTLLKLLSRITEPSAGQITMRGRVASLLEVGTGFHPELSGRENIYLNGAILGMSRTEIKSKFDDIVDFSGVEKFLDTPVKRYSSGMYVRLAFAIAAHLEPEILVVDEVLAVGDAEFQKKCIGKMEEVSKGQGRTVLFVSHNMAAIQNLCENAILMDSGQAKIIDSVDNVIKTYSDSLKDITSSRCKLSEEYRYIKEIWFENESHEICDSFLMGSSFYICVKITGRLDSINVGFNLSDVNSARVSSFGSMYQFKNQFINVEGEKILKFLIKKSNLMPGVYYLSFSLSDNFEMPIESSILAVRFEIDRCDIFGTGKCYEEFHGACYLDVSIEQYAR